MTTLSTPHAGPTIDSLDGATALVTGASRGIGAAIARRLDAAGARVIVTGRDASALEAVSAQLKPGSIARAVDLAEPGAAEQLLESVIDQAGRLDVLVNNAGMSGFMPSHALTAAAIDDLFAVNVRSVLLLAGRAAAHMAENGGGSIVNVSSVLAGTGAAGASAYAATKGALDALTRALAAEWGGRHVRVNAVNPGITRTDMTAGLQGIPGWEDFYNSQTVLGRLGEPGDIAGAVAFLASGAAGYITGQTLTVDGGWGMAGRIAPPR